MSSIRQRFVKPEWLIRNLGKTRQRYASDGAQDMRHNLTVKSIISGTESGCGLSFPARMLIPD